MVENPVRDTGAIATSHSLPEDIWCRDGEFLYRAADLLWARVGDRLEVMERRRCSLADSNAELIRCPHREALRYGDDFEEVCAWVATRWCTLFDAWHSKRSTFVFDDGFSVLFLVRLLWPNEVLIFRGQREATWVLKSTLARAEEQGTESLARSLERSRNFISELSRLPAFRAAYPGGAPLLHLEAILQHYGFPTRLLDCTYSPDVALYFAEGGDDVFLMRQTSGCGALYAFPAYVVSKTAVLTTLPPAIMRPSLQRGVFLANLASSDLADLELHKHTFRHHFLPIWNGIGGIDFGCAVGLGRYLFPMSDPIEEMAHKWRTHEDDTAPEI